MKSSRSNILYYALALITFFTISIGAASFAFALSCDGQPLITSTADEERLVSCYTPEQMDYSSDGGVSLGMIELSRAFDPMGGSGNNCGVCRLKESSYFDPQIGVAARSRTDFGGSLGKAFGVSFENWTALRPGECDTLYGSAQRVCARFTKPEEDLKKAFGNQTYYSNNPRLQLCGYYDPQDGMDTDPYFSPFHLRTPNDEAPTPEEAAETTLIVGGAFAAVASLMFPALALTAAAMLGFAAALSALVAVIMSTYNHFVFGNLGCVEVPLAPGPPAFSDDRWHAKFLTKPDIKIKETSDFFNINLEAYTCEIIGSTGDIYQKSTSCFDKNGVQIPGTRQIGSPVSFTLKTPNYKQEGITLPDGRVYTVKVMDNNPKSICLYKTARETESPWRIVAEDATEAEKVGISPDVLAQGGILEQCFQRPDFIPKPTLLRTRYTDENQLPEFNIRFGESEGKIVFDQTKNMNCTKLEKINFCMTRECDQFNSESGECTVPSRYICLSGFNSKYMAVYNAQFNTVIEGLPNTKIGNRYVYSPPFCYQKNFDGKCINYSGNCKVMNNEKTRCIEYEDEQEVDPYFINPQTMRLAGSSALNEGLCYQIPENNSERPEYLPTSLNKTYTVPKNCSKLRIEAIGAGGSGGLIYEDPWEHCARAFNGGSGAVGIWEVPVEQGQILKVRVGTSALHQDSGATTITHTYTEDGKTKRKVLSAGGGRALNIPGYDDRPPNNHGQISNNQGRLSDISLWPGAVRIEEGEIEITNTKLGLATVKGSNDGVSGTCQRHTVAIQSDIAAYGMPPAGYVFQNGNKTITAKGGAVSLRVMGGEAGLDSKGYRLRNKTTIGRGGQTFWGGSSPGNHGIAYISCVERNALPIETTLPCAGSEEVYLRYNKNPLKGLQYFKCNLPSSKHGEIPKVGACEEMSSPPPTNSSIQEAIHDPGKRAPLCDNSVWRY